MIVILAFLAITAAAVYLDLVFGPRKKLEEEAEARKNAPPPPPPPAVEPVEIRPFHGMSLKCLSEAEIDRLMGNDVFS